jgi:hypothetical protein
MTQHFSKPLYFLLLTSTLITYGIGTIYTELPVNTGTNYFSSVPVFSDPSLN